MKLKNFLIESAYWLGMLAALWFTVHSCAAQAQQRFSTPKAYHRIHPQIPDNGYVLYERNDSLFAMFSAGDEKYLNVARGVYEPSEDSIQKFGWITDFITWVATDTTFEGNLKCAHTWVFDAAKPGNVNLHYIFGFEIIDCTGLNPDGKHCNEHQSATREKICRKCLFSVIECEKWFQRFVAPPKSEFEILKEKQRVKQ